MDGGDIVACCCRSHRCTRRWRRGCRTRTRRSASAAACALAGSSRCRCGWWAGGGARPHGIKRWCLSVFVCVPSGTCFAATCALARSLAHICTATPLLVLPIKAARCPASACLLPARPCVAPPPAVVCHALPRHTLSPARSSLIPLPLHAQEAKVALAALYQRLTFELEPGQVG